ncbi:TIM-barrel domain-containing protein [Vibrio sp. HN007]|uniref:glycoside hydrolase family 31 protein n=1 Tax=Vibrio iocasae TaxID=3098914 RepID=UPI0035D4B841
MQQPTTISGVNYDRFGVTFNLDLGQLTLRPISSSAFRLSMQFLDESSLEYGQANVEPAELTDTIALWMTNIRTALDSGSVIELPLGEYRIQLHQRPLYLAVLHQDSIIYQDLPRRAYILDTNQRRAHYHQREDNDYYYGLGEKTGVLERSGRRFRMNNVDAVGYDPGSGDPLYKHIPFWVRYRPNDNHCVGLYYHNAHPCEFNIGCERSGYWGAYASYQVDSGQIDYVMMLGKTPAKILSQYHEITGYACMPTKASLGYMGSTMYYTELSKGADEAVLGFVDECQRQSIPLSGFHLSSGYTKGADGKRYTFNWDNNNFPDPQKFVADMQAKEMVLSPNVKPGLLTTHPLWQEFDQANAFIRTADGEKSKIERFWGGDASFVDFTNPVGRELWTKYLKLSLVNKGIVSIWNDNNEFEMDGDAQCNGDGTAQNASALKPVLSNLMAQASYDAIIGDKEGKGRTRPFILSRAGFAGIQTIAQTWSGDNDSSWKCFRYNIATMLGMSWSGVAFNGMDIGGFTGPAPSPELFLRWIQNGIFHPRFCIHSVNSDNTVTEPWIYPTILPQIRKAMQFRQQLLPTLYSVSRQVVLKGSPIVTPLSYFDIEDPNTREIDTAFLLGNSLYCAAIVEPEVDSLDIYLPKGEWVDWYTGERLTGGIYHQVKTQLDYSPLYMRAGSGVFIDTSDQESPNGLEIILAAWKTGQAYFYDDDGKTMDFELGEYHQSEFEWQAKASQIKLTVKQKTNFIPQWKQVRLTLLVQENCPHQIVINNQPLEQVLYQHQLNKKSWHYDMEKKQVTLQFDHSFWKLESAEITLNFDQYMVISMDD